MTADEILDEMIATFRLVSRKARRRFLPGLLFSFIRLVMSVRRPGSKHASLAEFYKEFPRQTRTPDGGSANTLIVKKREGGTQSIRPYYEEFQDWIRIEEKRLDYPSSAPHATQAWPDYVRWLDALVGMDDAALEDIARRVKAFTLAELPAHVRPESAIRKEPPRFYLFLKDFDFKASKRGPTGAAFQGTVFGYLRADAAHLQVQVGKVRTGGKRVGLVGDVDARDGEDLVLAAEVKQFKVQPSDVAKLEEFAQLVAHEGAVGLIVALDFGLGAREAAEEMGLHPVSRQELVDRVHLWDTLKQRNAVQALMYYVTQVEGNRELHSALAAFFEEVEKSFGNKNAASAKSSAPTPTPRPASKSVATGIPKKNGANSGVVSGRSRKRALKKKR